MCNMEPETEPFTHQRKVQNIGNTISQTDKQFAGPHKNSKNTYIVYEQHRLHKNLDPVVMNRQCKYPVYFLVATTSGFIHVACSRVQPRKVTIEKKDEINEYKKKKKYKKKGKDKKKSILVSPALYHGIFMSKSNVDTSIELDTIMCAN